MPYGVLFLLLLFLVTHLGHGIVHRGNGCIFGCSHMVLQVRCDQDLQNIEDDRDRSAQVQPWRGMHAALYFNILLMCQQTIILVFTYYLDLDTLFMHTIHITSRGQQINHRLVIVHMYRGIHRSVYVTFSKTSTLCLVSLNSPLPFSPSTDRYSDCASP